MKRLSLALALALFNCAFPLVPTDSAFAQPPSELGLVDERLGNLPPLGPRWRAFDPLDPEISPKHQGFELMLEAAERAHRGEDLDSDGCFPQAMLEGRRPPRSWNLLEHIQTAQLVATAKVLSVTPGVELSQFASAIEFEILEVFADRSDGTEPPRYVLYPAVEFHAGSDEPFCARGYGYPAPPREGDRIVVLLHEWRGNVALLWNENPIVQLEAQGAKAQTKLWESLPESPRASSAEDFEAWLRSTAQKTPK